MKHLIIKVQRDSYNVEDIRGMTVGELAEKLAHYDRDAIIAVQTGNMFCPIDNIVRIGWDERDAFKEING